MIFNLNSLKEKPGFVRYFKNTSWLFLEKILRMVIGLFVGLWIARYLGPDRFGLFSYAQSFVALFAAIAALGLDRILVRELVNQENRRDELIGTAFWLRFMGAIGVILVLVIAVRFTSNDQHTNVIVFIIASATIFQSFNVIDFYFQSRVLSQYVVYANVTSLLISSLIKVTLIFFEAPLIAFAYVVLFDSFVLATGFVYFYVTHTPKGYIQSLKFSRVTAVTLLRDSWPLLLSGMVISIYMKIDQVMIKEMMSSEAVGLYAAAVRISELWYFIPMVIASSLFPALISAKQQSEKLYYMRLQSLFNIMVWLAIVIAVPMTFLSDWVVEFLFGEQYYGAGSVLAVHIWAGIAVGFGVIWSYWVIIENKQHLVIIFHVLSMVLNVLLNFYLIPRLGILGAGIATAVASLVSQFVGLLVYKRNIALKFLTKALFPLYLISRRS